MKIGIPKEVKNHEYRVGATPAIVSLLAQAGHEVVIQAGAGERIGFSDAHYIAAGGKIASSIEQVYEAEMIVKVKEPQKSEFPFLREGQILFCFLHLSADPNLVMHLVERKIIGIAYETVVDKQGTLPLLTPMSEVAGRLAVQAGATALQAGHGGKGLLLGGVPGVPPAKVVILGGGVVGTQVARMAIGFGAEVTVIEKRLSRLRTLDELYGAYLNTIYSTPVAIAEQVAEADLVVGAVLLPGKRTPKLLTEEMIQSMEPGTVFVDVAIDQGGCSPTSRPTTFSEPTYVEHNVVHYCVANMPGGAPRTSTLALTHATAPYILELAEKGYREALLFDPGFLPGLNLYFGKVTHPEVAEDCGYTYHAPEDCLRHA